MLTKEDLEKIQLPLSDEDYLMLHEEGEKDPNIWRICPMKLFDAYDDLSVKYFDLTYPNNQVSAEDTFWVPPIHPEKKG